MKVGVEREMVEWSVSGWGRGEGKGGGDGVDAEPVTATLLVLFEIGLAFCCAPRGAVMRAKRRSQEE